MALIAESVVEEWLNRSGHFTIRGINLGNNRDIDLLAIRLENGRAVKLRHLECNVSFTNAVSQVTGPAKSRSKDQMEIDVSTWINKKFQFPRAHEIRQRLCAGTWSKELVLGIFVNQNEVDEIKRQGVTITNFLDVLKSLFRDTNIINKASGGDICELMSWAQTVHDGQSSGE